jgi:hypothetical protein
MCDAHIKKAATLDGLPYGTVHSAAPAPAPAPTPKDIDPVSGAALHKDAAAVSASDLIIKVPMRLINYKGTPYLFDNITRKIYDADYPHACIGMMTGGKHGIDISLFDD